MYAISNAYFMSHQPEFMLGMLIVMPAVIIGIALWDHWRMRKANKR